MYCALGGECLIVPLYMKEEFINQTGANNTNNSALSFDSDATIVEVHGWYNRFARHYNVDKFEERVLKNCQGLNVSIFYVENEKEIDQDCYSKLICILRKR